MGTHTPVLSELVVHREFSAVPPLAFPWPQGSFERTGGTEWRPQGPPQSQWLPPAVLSSPLSTARRKSSSRSWVLQWCRVLSPCLHALVDSPGVCVGPFLNHKAELVPTVASLQPSPGSSTRGWPWCGCSHPVPAELLLQFGWTAAAAGML